MKTKKIGIEDVLILDKSTTQTAREFKNNSILEVYNIDLGKKSDCVVKIWKPIVDKYDVFFRRDPYILFKGSKKKANNIYIRFYEQLLRLNCLGYSYYISNIDMNNSAETILRKLTNIR